MANVQAPFGALDFMHQGGSQRTEELRQAWILSSDPTPIFYGDLVAPQLTLISSNLQNAGVGPYVTQGTSAVTTIAPPAVLWAGVFRGCELFNTALNKMYYSRYWPGQSAAGTSSLTGDIKAYIVSDTNMRFLIQVSSQNTLGTSNVGMVANVGTSAAIGGPSSTSGNTVTGNSGMNLWSTSALAITSTSTAAFAFKIMDFYSNWGPGLLPGMVPGVGTGQFVNGMDNTTAGQYVIVQPYAPQWVG